jgi:hypothetical protein
MGQIFYGAGAVVCVTVGFGVAVKIIGVLVTVCVNADVGVNRGIGVDVFVKPSVGVNVGVGEAGKVDVGNGVLVEVGTGEGGMNEASGSASISASFCCRTTSSNTHPCKPVRTSCTLNQRRFPMRINSSGSISSLADIDAMSE